MGMVRAQKTAPLLVVLLGLLWLATYSASAMHKSGIRKLADHDARNCAGSTCDLIITWQRKINEDRRHFLRANMTMHTLISHAPTTVESGSSFTLTMSAGGELTGMAANFHDTPPITFEADGIVIGDTSGVDTDCQLRKSQFIDRSDVECTQGSAGGQLTEPVVGRWSDQWVVTKDEQPLPSVTCATDASGLQATCTTPAALTGSIQLHLQRTVDDFIWRNGDVPTIARQIASGQELQNWSAFDALPATMTDTITVTLVASGQPDLLTEDLAALPATPSSGTLTSFAATIRNNSQTATGASHAQLRLDIDADGSWDLTPAQVAVPDLAADESVSVTWSDIWVATPGTHRFEICADAQGQVAESNEDNNCTIQTLTVADSCPPTSPQPIRAKVVFDVVRNSGPGDMQPQVFLGDGSRYGNNEWFELNAIDRSINPDVPGFAIRRDNNALTVHFYGHHPGHGEIAAGYFMIEGATFSSVTDDPRHPVEKQGDGRWSNPRTWPIRQGGYNNEIVVRRGNPKSNFYLRVGEDEDIFTLRYTPADTQSSSSPDSCSTAKADLAITNITATGSLNVGEPVTLTGVVQNIGNGLASTSTTELKIDEALIAAEPTGALVPLKTEEESAIWTPTKTGRHTFTICADAGNTVPESNENNNCGSFTFTVAANQAPIAVAAVALNGSPATKQVTVTQGVPVTLTLVAEDSNDPDGWSHPSFGVAQGGSCEWNSDFNQDPPTFEKTIPSPATPADCNFTLPPLTFHDSPGTYTYSVLRITDARGAVSNLDTVTITIQEPPSSEPPSSTPAPVFRPGPFLEID